MRKIKKINVIKELWVLRRYIIPISVVMYIFALMIILFLVILIGN
jgi:hypothetical protein